MNGLVKISDVAKFLGINQKTIRYYEEYGLCSPMYVDPNTKYRYYNIDNINRLTYILDLRSCGLSMKVIKEYLNENLDVTALINDLNSKKNNIEQIIRSIESRLIKENDYKVEIMNTFPFKALTKEVVADDLQHLYKELREFATEAINKTIMNKSMMSYVQFLEYNPSLKNLKFKIGIPVKSGYNEEVSLGKVLHTYHSGSIFDKERAYNALKVFAFENGYKIRGEGIEFYHKSYSLVTAQSDTLVEICLPIE